LIRQIALKGRCLTYVLIVAQLLLVVSSVNAASLGIPSAVSRTQISDSMKEYRIGGNDVLEITVYGEDDLSEEVRVTNSGYISYPLIGRIKVAGKTVAGLEDFLRDALAKDFIRNPVVRVFVVEFSNIYVLGKVNEPGPYLFKGGMTILQAITTAGGFTRIANQRKVRVVRAHGAEREVIHVNVNRITKGHLEDFVLHPGDIVVVPESFF